MTQYTNNYAWLTKKYGKVMENHQELGKALREAGPIPEKDARETRQALRAWQKSRPNATRAVPRRSPWRHRG